MASKRKDYFDDQYYVLHRRFLTLIGLWPYQKKSTRLHLNLFISAFLVAGVIMQIYVLLTIEWDIKKITEQLQTFLPTVCFACSYINYLWNFEILRNTLDVIKNELQMLVKEEETMSMEKYAYECELCFIAIACIIYLYLFIFLLPSLVCSVKLFLGALVDSELILPIPIKYFQTNEIKYLAFLWIEIFAFVIVCATGIIQYTVFTLCVQHACALFHKITIKIEEPFDSAEDMIFFSKSANKNVLQYNWWLSVMQYYNNAIEFVERIKKLYGTIYAVEIFCGWFIVVTDFLCIMQFNNLTIKEISMTILYFFGTMSIIYLYIYLGQRLINKSTSVHTKCCEIPFYELSIKTNKMILLFLMRIKKPCFFSVKGLMVVSNSTFFGALKASFSFATMYYKLNK